MSFYAEHEAGDLMSRITNDTETISQAINFALLQVLGGLLLLVWIGYSMLKLSVPYALISLIVVPAMLLATIWFSGQARKAFRKARQDLGNVNAELQESISSVREVQAFSREKENIQNFMVTNAANRDANVKAVAYTSALAPTLEALGYVALALVACSRRPGAAAQPDPLRHDHLAGPGDHLHRLCPALQPADPADRHPVDQHPERHRRHGAHLQPAGRGAAVLDKPNAQAMPPIVGTVEFKDVYAAYKKDESVLNGISFTAEPGKTIAIVGPTGAGKTTIINLMPALLRRDRRFSH